MKAKVTKEFAGVDDGGVHPRTILKGEEVTGDLAWTAVSGGNAEWVKGGEPTPEDEERYRAQARQAPVRGGPVSGTAIDDFKREAAADALEERGGLTANEAQNTGAAALGRPDAPAQTDRQPTKTEDNKSKGGKGKAKK
ncbi:MAG: hypothetical protein AB7S41_20130 [Parvibaculaceae bacterium]